MKIISILFLILSGCYLDGGKLKCVDGVLYLKDNGAWVQAKLYENNKCLPIEDEAKK